MTRRWIDAEAPNAEAERAQELLRALDAAPPTGAAGRVWRRLEGREVRPRSLRAWAIVPALAVAALVIAAVVARVEPRGAGGAASGAVARVVEGGVRGARAGEVLAVGARIEVAEAGRIALDLGGSELALAGPGALVVRADGVVLEAGMVEVASRDRALVVIAGAWRAEVVGGVVRAGDGVGVEARRGTAVVRGPGDVIVEVAEGTRWASGGADEAALRGGASASARAPDEAVRVVSGAGEPVVAESGEGVREEAVPGAQAERRARAERRSVTRVRAEGRASARAHREATSGEDGTTRSTMADAEDRAGEGRATSASRDVSPSVGEVSPAPGGREAPAIVPVMAPKLAPPEVPSVAPSVAPSRAPSVAPSTAPSVAPSTAPAWDEDATYQRARAERDPSLALPLFDAVVSQQGALAEVAALQAAELQLRRGLNDDALRRFTALITARPRSALLPEARLGAIDCQLRLGRLEDARAGLDVALAAGGSDASSLHFLRAELARRSGRCEEALADYRAVTRGRRADDAAYHQAWCLLTIDEADGEAALRDYLARHPSGRHAEKARARLAATKKE